MAKQMIAVIGAGGKTTAMGVLARQCKERSVLVTTTTHIYPMPPKYCDRCMTNPNPAELISSLAQPGVVCAGTATAQGKLSVLAKGALHAGISAADVVIYEGDGAKRLPLKLHRENEPVLLPGTTKYLVVAGLSALGKPIPEAVHRYELEPEFVKNAGGCVDTKEFIHCVLEAAGSTGCVFQKVQVFLNQEDSCRETEKIQEIKDALIRYGLKVRSGSLHKPPKDLYDWMITG